MGLNINGLRFLLQAAARGITFGRTLTIGRQDASLTDREVRTLPAALRALLDGVSVTDETYADAIFQRLGACSVDALDATAYEGATVLHDLNRPIPDAWPQQYDLVFDGGSLEHVFDVPQALRNYMAMLKVGGHLIIATPTNNFCGHGFYQFGPELFFAAFAPTNGFSLLEAMLYEENGWHRWYRLTPSPDLSRRLTFQNRVPAHLLILARKNSEQQAFATAPHQTIYEYAWTAPTPSAPSKRVRLLAMLPARLRWFLANTWNVQRRFRADLFKPVKPE